MKPVDLTHYWMREICHSALQVAEAGALGEQIAAAFELIADKGTVIVFVMHPQIAEALERTIDVICKKTKVPRTKGEAN